jgi:hypothetical protein
MRSSGRFLLQTQGQGEGHSALTRLVILLVPGAGDVLKEVGRRVEHHGVRVVVVAGAELADGLEDVVDRDGRFLSAAGARAMSDGQVGIEQRALVAVDGQSRSTVVVTGGAE